MAKRQTFAHTVQHCKPLISRTSRQDQHVTAVDHEDLHAQQTGMTGIHQRSNEPGYSLPNPCRSFLQPFS